MKICTVNFDSEWLNIEKNLSKMEADILSILKTQKDVDTIVFPELNTSGYVTEDSLKSVAEKKNDQLILSV
jgi:predicted amidohydrolase|tara:strand:- start:302 stop:514 length:213 start_codon:yes stop_codon:yes gene_type:complete